MKKRIIALAVLATLFVGGTALAAQDNKPVKTADKQVYCNQEGNSGKWKAQIANGAPNEHEQKLDGVFVHDQGDVTAEMDAKCQELYGGNPSEKCELPKVVYNESCVDPKACPAGTTLIDYKDPQTKQDPICKDDPTGCPNGDSIPVDSPKCTGTTADDPNKGEVKSTTPTPVEDTVYPEFQGK